MKDVSANEVVVSVVVPTLHTRTWILPVNKNKNEHEGDQENHLHLFWSERQSVSVTL